VRKRGGTRPVTPTESKSQKVTSDVRKESLQAPPQPAAPHKAHAAACGKAGHGLLAIVDLPKRASLGCFVAQSLARLMLADPQSARGAFLPPVATFSSTPAQHSDSGRGFLFTGARESPRGASWGAVEHVIADALASGTNNFQRPKVATGHAQDRLTCAPARAAADAARASMISNCW
jgi:hypothetical protein